MNQHQEYNDAMHRDNSDMNVGSPQQHSQKMQVQETSQHHEDDPKSAVATLPKNLQNKVEINKMNEIDYVPENPEFDLESVKESPHFKVKNYPEAIYMGEIQKGVRQGWGIMRYASGRLYEGEWVDDIR